MPTVSVITPTYNRSDILPRAIDSVLSQSFEDLEHVIVDDGSDDQTNEVVARYDDERVRYIYQENMGANAARNRGIKAASGEYITFLDSDDEYLSRRIERILSILRDVNSEYIGVAHSYRIIYRNGQERISKIPSGRITFNDLRSDNPIGPLSCALFKRDVIDQIDGFDPELPASQDYDLYLRALQEGPMISVKEELMRHYRLEDSISADPKRKAVAHKLLREKHGDIITRERIARQHYSLAHQLAVSGDLDSARTEFALATLQGRDPLAAYHWLLTWGGKSVYDFGVKVKRKMYTIVGNPDLHSNS